MIRKDLHYLIASRFVHILVASWIVDEIISPASKVATIFSVVNRVATEHNDINHLI
jgi:uncharacterized protein YacL (UPF0231 family)